MTYDNVVETTTTHFGEYNTGSTGTVMLPSMVKLKELMRELIEDEMVDLVLFDVQDGGSENQVGYMRCQTDNLFVQEKIEDSIFRGIRQAGIVFNEDMTAWHYAADSCEHCNQETCVWEEKKEEMVAYNNDMLENSQQDASSYSIQADGNQNEWWPASWMGHPLEATDLRNF
jgi:hypothetical protein